MKDKEVSRMKTFWEVVAVDWDSHPLHLHIAYRKKQLLHERVCVGGGGWMKTPMEERKAVQILHQMFTLSCVYIKFSPAHPRCA